MTTTAPSPVAAGIDRTPVVKRFASATGRHVLIVPHSRIYDLPDEWARRLDAGDPVLDAVLRGLAATADGEMPLDAMPTPAPQSISLNVSSSCNLSCGYCYAGGGHFSARQPDPMTFDTARAAIDALLERADPTAPITIGFMGGEPFVNRRLIHRSVAYAGAQGARRGLDVRYSVTTNGTLLEPEDLDLMRAHPFAVTVSVDGSAALHDSQRPDRRGRRGFDALAHRIAPLLAQPGSAKVCARATVVRGAYDLAERLDAVAALGFSDIGFSPVRSSATPGLAFEDGDWGGYLQALVAVARCELRRAVDGGNIRLANLAIALKQMQRGAASPFPCGAGGGYFSVAANGDWYTCHRAIGRPEFFVGPTGAFDEGRRAEFLRPRHVHAQPACSTCWARYLCSGGCHQEAAQRSPAACDFIRGWLEFCLAAYCDLAAQRPQWFAAQRPPTQGERT